MLLVIQPNLQGKKTTEFSCNNYEHTNKNYYNDDRLTAFDPGQPG